MTRLIQCKACKTVFRVTGKKSKNGMLNIIPMQVDPDHYPHKCEGVKDEWLLYENRFKNPTIN